MTRHAAPRSASYGVTFDPAYCRKDAPEPWRRVHSSAIPAHRGRRAHHRILLLALLVLIPACDDRPTPPRVRPGGDTPVTAARLAGARLESATDGGGTTWNFTPQRVTISHGAGRLPAHVTEALRLPQGTPSPLAAVWRLEDSGLVLILSDLDPPPPSDPAKPDSAPPDRTDRRVPVRPMGHVRVEINGVQYNLMKRR
jgi:hypothetical protein